MTRAQQLNAALERVAIRTQRLADARDADGAPLTYVRRSELMIEQRADLALVRTLALPMTYAREAHAS